MSYDFHEVVKAEPGKLFIQKLDHKYSRSGGCYENCMPLIGRPCGPIKQIDFSGHGDVFVAGRVAEIYNPSKGYRVKMGGF